MEDRIMAGGTVVFKALKVGFMLKGYLTRLLVGEIKRFLDICPGT